MRALVVILSIFLLLSNVTSAMTLCCKATDDSIQQQINSTQAEYTDSLAAGIDLNIQEHTRCHSQPSGTDLTVVENSQANIDHNNMHECECDNCIQPSGAVSQTLLSTSKLAKQLFIIIHTSPNTTLDTIFSPPITTS